MDVNDSPTVDKLGSGENQSTPDPANVTTDTTNTTADKKNTTTDDAIARPDATNTSPSESEETTRGRKMKAKNEEVIDEAIRAQINQLSGGNGKSAGRRNWRRNEKSESRSTQSLADENDPGGGEKTFDFPKQVNNNARRKNKKKEETIQSTAESYYSTISDGNRNASLIDGSIVRPSVRPSLCPSIPQSVRSVFYYGGLMFRFLQRKTRSNGC